MIAVATLLMCRDKCAECLEESFEGGVLPRIRMKAQVSSHRLDDADRILARQDARRVDIGRATGFLHARI
jgi:hypothetical protein